jgi:hypothetical protein
MDNWNETDSGILKFCCGYMDGLNIIIELEKFNEFKIYKDNYEDMWKKESEKNIICKVLYGTKFYKLVDQNDRIMYTSEFLNYFKISDILELKNNEYYQIKDIYTISNIDVFYDL